MWRAPGVVSVGKELSEEKGEAVAISHIQHMTIIEKYYSLEVLISQVTIQYFVCSWFLVIHPPLKSLEKFVKEVAVLKILTKRHSFAGHVPNLSDKKENLNA